MGKIVIGSYYDATSVLHRCDPRMKMTCAALFFVAVFVAPGFPGMALVAVFTTLMIRLSNIPVKTVLNSIVPLLFILIFTVFFNLIFGTGDDVLWHWAFINVTTEGVYKAAFYPLRMALLLLGMSLLTLTTSPIDLTDAFESIMRPLGKLGFPAHEFAMMLGLALRFLPVFADELVKIRRAQESRGADFGGGSLVNRIKVLLPIIVPLFVSALRHSDNLALAMESRCYHGGVGRTHMHVLKMGKRDVMALLSLIGLLVAAIALRVLI